MDFTQHSESPSDFHLWTGVSVIASALRRRVWIDMKYFEWTPNFYVILVGPPGVASKSTSMRIGQSLLSDLNIHIGPTSMTWQALAESLEEAHEMVNMGEHIDGPYMSMSCVSCFVGELGTFLNPRDKELVDVLVSLWDGQQEVFHRRTRSQGDTKIFNPWLNLIACTTPAWLTENFPESMVGGGLTSRIVFVYGDTKRRLIAYPAFEMDHKETAEQEGKLKEDLLQISMLKGEYKLTADAVMWGEDWYKKHWTQDTSHTLERYEGYMARKQTHIHKISMIIAAASRDDLHITVQDLKQAEQLTTCVEYSMQKVFSAIGSSETNKQLERILKLLTGRSEGVARNTLWRRCLTHQTAQQFEDALNAGISAGYIKAIQKMQGIVYSVTSEHIDLPSSNVESIEAYLGEGSSKTSGKSS